MRSLSLPQSQVAIFSYEIATWFAFLRDLLTPTFVKRHTLLCAELAKVGITQKYEYSGKQAWKKHLVSSESTKHWRAVRALLGFQAFCVSLGIRLLYRRGFFEKSFTVKLLLCAVIAITLVPAIILGILYLITHLVTNKLFGSEDRAWTDHKFITWKNVSARSIPVLPEEATKAFSAATGVGAHTRVEEAFENDVRVDPFLTVSVLPFWLNDILCAIGITRFNLTVSQWDDQRFHELGFAKKVAIT